MFGYSNTTTNTLNWVEAGMLYHTYNYGTSTTAYNWGTSTTTTSGTYTSPLWRWYSNEPEWYSNEPERYSNEPERKIDPDESEWVSDELDEFIGKFSLKEGENE